jgi:putative ABC transport system permease protein
LCNHNLYKVKLKDSRIMGVGKTIHLQGGEVWHLDVNIENNDGVMEERQMVQVMGIGNDFIKVMGMELAEGREYSGELKSDLRSGLLVNETLVKKMGWKAPLGKHIQRTGNPRSIIGVVKDFHFLSLHQQVEPLFIVLNNINYANIPEDRRAGQSNTLIVNISGEDTPGTLDYIRRIFEKFDPEHSFEYEFLDDILDKPYILERRLMKFTGIFSGICILISCLGLFGLAAFNTERRTKEIGVRKVLGATTFQIIVMLSRSILLIILAASVVASLVAWLAIDEWLTEFAYHTGINPLVFVFSAAIALAVAFGTVALQSFKTAQENPVEALRYE